MQTGTLLFFYLINRMNPAPKVTDLNKFLLDGLQPFLPFAVSDLSLCAVPSLKAIFLIQLLNLSDLGAETGNLVTKDFCVIHITRIPHLEGSRRSWGMPLYRQP